ncbi:MAG: DUF484 family protein [Gammaproteobacteria bacterium]|nr:DUF484 family protein [Gammaproteobacteria bacterium]
MQSEPIDAGRRLDADAVVRFLRLNPDFFNQNSDVLPRLRIPHHTGGAVSLIEKQVSVLRSKCATLESSLHDLISVARDNEQLHQRLHSLIQELISAQSITDVVSLTRDSLIDNFNADDVRLVLMQPDENAVTDEHKEYQWLATAGEDYDAFQALFEKRDTLCGEPTEAQMAVLTREAPLELASAAIIPLFYEKELGLLVLTSRDEHRFASGKGVMFLNQLGEVLSRRVHTFLQ